MEKFDVVVIGGGPAGIAAAIKASEKSSVLLVEREGKLGGILKQCIHDGFGVVRFKKRLSGPEYANEEILKLNKTNVSVKLMTFVTRIVKDNVKFNISIVNTNGIGIIECDKLILATGCRERTSKQVAIHGTNPSGVFSAGTAQYYINIMGKSPTKKCVILGSGDIGLIMARRLTLEGSTVLGVYEAKSSPSGLTRNVVQCLDDFNIPLHLSHTVSRVFGVDRLSAVEVVQVDERMNPIKGTEKIVECDSLILSVGLIPENEVATSLGVKLSSATKGPICDQTFMTNVDNVYVCGNACHVNDLADYVSESGEFAGDYSSQTYARGKQIQLEFNNKMLYLVPQIIDLNKPINKCVFYFRSNADYNNMALNVYINGTLFNSRKYTHLRPPEMERLTMDFTKVADAISSIEFKLEEVK